MSLDIDHQSTELTLVGQGVADQNQINHQWQQKSSISPNQIGSTKR
jgi:hypothetical protein